MIEFRLEWKFVVVQDAQLIAEMAAHVKKMAGYVSRFMFNPGAPGQLWTYNMLIHGTVIFFDPGTQAQKSEVRADAYGQHFMAYVSSAAFGDNGNFASCQESRNEWNVGPQAPDPGGRVAHCS